MFCILFQLDGRQNILERGRSTVPTGGIPNGQSRRGGASPAWVACRFVCMCFYCVDWCRVRTNLGLNPGRKNTSEYTGNVSVVFSHGSPSLWLELGESENVTSERVSGEYDYIKPLGTVV